MKELTEFEYKQLIKNAEKERDEFLQNNPDLQWLQDQIDNENKIIGDNPYDRLKVLWQGIGSRATLVGEQVKDLNKESDHLSRMLEGAARVLSRLDTTVVSGDSELSEISGMGGDGREEDFEENIKKGLTNLLKQGKLEKKGSVFIPINEE